MEQTSLHPGGLDLTTKLLDRCGLTPGARVLDVGCGFGTTVARLRQNGLEAVGVDLSPPPAEGLVRADGAALPFEDASMDAVLFECSLSKMDRRGQAVKEARRVLKKGGRLGITDLFSKGTPARFTGLLGELRPWADIRREIERAGFRLLAFEEHSQALHSYWAGLLFEMGSEAALERMGGSEEALRQAKCSYFLAVFEAADAPPPALYEWVCAEAGINPKNPDALHRWQMERIRETLGYAKENSPFYREHLAAVQPVDIRSPEDLARVPFLDGGLLAKEGPRLLCVSQSAVARVRTFETSGSTGQPKRIYFTQGDMERTVDFFSRGMRPIAAPGTSVAILMSDETPGSIGDLLVQGLARYGANGHIGGNVRDVKKAAELVKTCGCAVGVPGEMLYLCRKAPELRPASVLLSADYVSPSVIRALEETWGSVVFTHYGLTETCYGLAVQCGALEKQHLRSANFHVEIVDPETGELLPLGTEGEVVLTSLRSEALPLIRYRTGDMGSLTRCCACGCGLPGLGPIKGRLVNLKRRINIHRLDDLLFGRPGVLGYAAEYRAGTLHLTIEGSLADESELRHILGGDVRILYGAAPPFTGGKRRIGGRP